MELVNKMAGLSINTAKLKTIYNTTVDFMLTSDLFSNSSKLYYPPRKIACPNVIGNNNHFGCLTCGGNGYKEVEETEDIRLRIYSGSRFAFEKNQFRKIGLNIDKVSGEVLTLGYLSDGPKILACNYVIFYNDIEFNTWKFKLAGEPIPYGFCRDRYIACFWERDDHV